MNRGSGPGGDGAAASWLRRHWWVPVGGLLVVAAAVAVVIASMSGSDNGRPTPKGTPFDTALTPIPTNRVTGSGSASVRLNGDVATVTVRTRGLLGSSPHALHLHAGARGICPPASAAHLHNGHRTISTLDGGPFYGHPQAALTTRGDTTPDSILAFARYPHTGAIRYSRTFRVSPPLAEFIRTNNAVVIVHGVDYNHNGIYDSVLDRSDLDRTLPGEATAPALCGPLHRVAGGQRTTALSHPPTGVYVASLAAVSAAATTAPSAPGSFICHLGAVAAPPSDSRSDLS